MLLVLLVVIVASSAVLLAQVDQRRLAARQADETLRALAAAKRALLDYAAIYPDLAGGAVQLPCPDLDAGGAWPEGAAHTTNCGAAGVSMLGRFPWRTLETAVARDANASCLWYAVSGTYKSAATATAAMINPDSNGQLELYAVESGALLQGALPEDRPVAILIAPSAPLPGQTRSGVGAPGQQCSSDFAAAGFLDTATGIGVSNASLSGTADALDRFAVSAAYDPQHNDRVMTISRAELAAAAYRRADLEATMQLLARGVASCIAAYGLQNPSGAGDRRLPWPTTPELADYAADTAYDDVDDGVLSGRLPDRVDDSGTATGNPVGRLLSDCDPALAPDWQPALLALWRNWKDHFFYVVAESFAPGASPPTSCTSCLSMNGAGQYAAIVLFAGRRLPALNQRRNAPPIDADTKRQIGNYLEGANAVNHPYTGGSADYQSQPAGPTFNDVAFCIDAAMNVSPC